MNRILALQTLEPVGIFQLGGEGADAARSTGSFPDCSSCSYHGCICPTVDPVEA